MGSPASATGTAYDAVTTGCGLVDRSEQGKLALTGDQAREFLAGQVTNDIEGLEPGTGCYAALLDNKGKMLADLRVLFTPGGEELLLICERSALQALFDGLRRSVIGWRAELHKRTVQQGLFSLLGMQARTVAGATDLPAVEHATAWVKLDGRRVLVAATDVGVDVVCAADDADAVRAALLDRGALAVDEATAELRRVETGRPRYGVDLDATVIPQEAGLNDRAVSFTKGCYVGQETVARLFYRGKPNRHLRGLRLHEAVPPGTVLRASAGEDARVLGTITSVALSPMHGPIGLALVRREAAAGDTVLAGTVPAEVVELPF